MYKAELLMPPTSTTPPLHLAVNGGCNLASKCAGANDNIAEEIQINLPNSGVVTATWIPRKRQDRSMFTATFAGYEEPNGDYIRLDNAHRRDILHMDVNYGGYTDSHNNRINLASLQIADRRRISLLKLMRILEQNVNWRIPVWFYMPWTMWWEEYHDFPERLKSMKPSGYRLSDVCEGVMAYLSFKPATTESFLSKTGITRQTLEAIKEAVDRVVFDLDRTGEFEFSQIVFGRIIIIPFPLYAPPGSTLYDSTSTISPLMDNPYG